MNFYANPDLLKTHCAVVSVSFKDRKTSLNRVANPNPVGFKLFKYFRERMKIHTKTALSLKNSSSDRDSIHFEFVFNKKSSCFALYGKNAALVDPDSKNTVKTWNRKSQP